MRICTCAPVARDEDRIRGTIPTPTFAGRPSTLSSWIPWDILQNSVVGQQRQQISEFQFDKFPNPQPSLLWKIRFKNQVTICSDIDSLEELKSSRSVSGKNVQFFEILYPKITSSLKKIIRNSNFKNRVSI